MDCHDAQALFSLLLKGELDESVRTRREQHLTGCESCREALGEFRRIRALLERSADEMPAGMEEALEGLEARVLARPDAFEPAPSAARPPRQASRFALHLSLAANGCLVLILAAMIFIRIDSTRTGEGPLDQTLRTAIPATVAMNEIYRGAESLFGTRLDWIAEAGGHVTLGIINNAADVPAEAVSNEPLVALVYWLDDEGNPSQRDKPTPVVIVTRPGRIVRPLIAQSAVPSPFQIVVDSLLRRRGGFELETAVRSTDPRSGEASVSAALTIRPDRPTRLGQVRLGDRLYGAYVALTPLNGQENHGAVL